MRGEDVAMLQGTLVQKGFLNIPPSVTYGFFGPLTRNATIKYQASVGLQPDGIFGQLTISKLILDLEE
jgi:peptidoglycan hydrolase-like protein with peptidoglycan-binding domain